MISNKLSAITSIFLGSVIILLTGFSIALIHNSFVFIFLLVVLFLFSGIRAYFKTYNKDKKYKNISRVLSSLFNKVSQSSTSTKSVNKADEPNNIESHKVHEEYCSTNEQISQMSSSPMTADKTPDSDNPNIDEWLKVFENDCPAKGQESLLSLDKYLDQNDYFLKDEIIEAIEWKRFELLCHLMFKATGYNSELTGNGADEGVDIRIFNKNDPSKTIYLVQCKKWTTTRKVKREHIQQLRGQMATENVEKGGFCATCEFTLPAKEYAEANNIELFGQQKIVESFNNLNIIDRKLILKNLLEGDYWTPTCASCGEKFESIRQKNGKMVWGCKKIKEHGWSQITYYEAAPIKNVL